MYGDSTHRRHRPTKTEETSANNDAVTANNINGETKKLKRKIPKKVRRKRRGGGTGSTSPNAFLCCAFVIAVIMVGAWITVLSGLQPSADGDKMKEKGSAANAELKPAVEHKLSEAIVDPNEEETLNTTPWEGWQPPFASKMETTWNQCIKQPNTYSSCRDLESDLGPAPPEPNENWIPDVKMLRRMYLRGVDSDGNPWPPPLPKGLCAKIGPSGGTSDTNKNLIDIVPIVAQRMDRTEEEARSEGLTNNKVLPPSDRPMPKIMCSLYTMASAHAGSIRAIRETWAGGCDGFLAFSTESDPRIPAISIPHDGPEEYDNMWQKIRSIWRFVGTHYIDDFDYFYIGGDDLFVLPQNLREYLWTIGDPEDDRYVGRRFLPDPNNPFNSGGAGYVLSRGTLRKFVEVMDKDPKCLGKRHTAQEDVMIARCLKDIFGITYMDTRDEEDRERFHPFAPGHHYTWRPPEEGQSRDWYEEYNREWGIKLGKDCCAPDSVSFHYIKKPTMVRHISALLYICDSKNGGGNLRLRPA
uniref:Hexosyltransferase n=1 Tax=Helicotheca tamesis TaxID=374047 RepID=A0A6U0GX63_9STRA|mmetsp:Transcript_3518/g.4763  ORF Transcript_3518/g.4763 Transcript_3518/m.4763 type:complete len:526 (+) Transcript_3518:168-1745(+)|eukprot:CAMPEP_0185737406 /NCGR_PEP_ID=MMETSP1171-20130828/30314_1 /TAXON_ID=374046 /ORGANISM="Helicotheca tamensis, Strain CCMP826" /LENGTH=525 /DNA_ID=CAMNT_0028408319 /DNA_START=81 /DNA_END=1658 /DNA_ORIENTATION=+